MDPQDGGLTNHFGLDDEKADSEADNLVPSHNNLGNLADLLSKAKEIEDELPDRTTSNRGEQQFWSFEQRKANMEHAHERGREALSTHTVG